MTKCSRQILSDEKIWLINENELQNKLIFPDYPYRTLITGGSWSGKANVLLKSYKLPGQLIANLGMHIFYIE